MPRRLAHAHLSLQFSVRLPPSQDAPPSTLEEVLLRNIRPCLTVHYKYALKGHSVDTMVKHVEKQVHVTPSVRHGGYHVLLNMHVQHYTKLHFDKALYLAKCTADLGLPPASLHETRTKSLDVVEAPTEFVPRKDVSRKGALQ